jgi:DNA-binding CsgD family transcriptional regulator
MQALIAIGHTAIAIARELRVSREFVSNLLAGRYPTIRRRYATAVAELYRQWSTIPGPSKRSRTTAAQRGFHGPLAWGDDIDDPAAVPETDVTEAELNRDELAAERVTEMWLLASAGQQPEQIARRLGMSANQVRNRLSTLFPHLYLELTA